MTAALGGVDLNSIITQMQSSGGAGDVLEDSRRILLRAAKEVQYSLETPKETCDRFRYSVRAWMESNVLKIGTKLLLIW